MATERTLTIIKPDSVAALHIGEIVAALEQAGFRILAMKMLRLTRAQAEGFYHVHRERPFFRDLVRFMTEGPCVPIALERDNAIAELRSLMGATDPAKAAAGTIRKRFGTSIERNAIHGSDAPETAAFELGFFFPGCELAG
ncbi:MAG TPA: nucleoside-diphosphate kinase [Bryobacterales bacterium]|nr:nucleoside-diphosphate kinase [Bryobacterales bacterium]